MSFGASISYAFLLKEMINLGAKQGTTIRAEATTLIPVRHIHYVLQFLCLIGGVSKHSSFLHFNIRILAHKYTIKSIKHKGRGGGKFTNQILHCHIVTMSQ